MKSIMVIPTYNEAENIEKLIKQIFSLNLSKLSKKDILEFFLIIIKLKYDKRKPAR